MCIGDFEVTPRESGHAHDLPFLPIPIDPKRVAAEIPVRDLNFELKRLQAAHADGSHGTRTARFYARRKPESEVARTRKITPEVL